MKVRICRNSLTQKYFFVKQRFPYMILQILQYSAYNQKSIIQWSMGSSRQFTVKNRGDDVLAFFGSDTDR